MTIKVNTFYKVNAFTLVMRKHLFGLYMKEETPKFVGKLRERQKAQTYKLILESARTLFDELGFEKTTMRAVAARAEIGLGTIYKYVSQKNGLLAAAFFDDLKRIMEKTFDALTPNLSLKTKLLYIAGQYYDFYAIRPSLSRTYLIQLSQFDSIWMKRIIDLDETYLSGVTHQIDEAKKTGEVRKNVDSYLVATAFLSHYLYVLAIHMALNCIASEPMLKDLEGLIDLLLSGISSPEDLV